MLNINESRSYLSEEISAALTDEQIALILDQMQVLSEVMIDHALTAKI